MKFVFSSFIIFIPFSFSSNLRERVFLGETIQNFPTFPVTHKRQVVVVKTSSPWPKATVIPNFQNCYSNVKDFKRGVLSYMWVIIFFRKQSQFESVRSLFCHKTKTTVSTLNALLICQSSLCLMIKLTKYPVFFFLELTTFYYKVFTLSKT